MLIFNRKLSDPKIFIGNYFPLCRGVRVSNLASSCFCISLGRMVGFRENLENT